MKFTKQLLASQPDLYHLATHAAFLDAAAKGTVPKATLGRWLANDRLYIHAYVKGAGRLLDLLDLPDLVNPDGPAATEERLLQWLVDALVNVRREEKFFVDVAAKFGIDVNLPALDSSSQGGLRVRSEEKIAGLRAFEKLFSRIGTGTTPPPTAAGVRRQDEPRQTLLPWLAPAVLFWATEKCYLEAWSGAKAAQEEGRDPAADADGGALRSEFIDNWSSAEFRDFVDQLGDIIDDGVEEAIRRHGVETLRDQEWTSETWKEVLVAEKDFWPQETE
ncbi:hypothetical protein CORC01_01917 [Colletotrichum orchidophilum]|uniref:Thiaminase-2/PQQC domain-containing protein n=1 Tax=Colletotrichum orchidophilum TaxID=1209926 RepID=A0A1G4BNF0_9PEZI|nr:uncharacterized protein CORC01_01917 [Colletotrichum orchidophilum]OHF02816.1 hypothetical protein CORC01_01917 [Colletotrichum orchidophilum]